jgi:pyrroline-5-carboxylate reductase
MNIAIIGAGNIGVALARGLAVSGKYKAEDITLIRRNTAGIQHLENEGFKINFDSVGVAEKADVIVFAVLPQQLNQVMMSISGVIDPTRHIVISMVSGVTSAAISTKLNSAVPVVRAMPNTAIAIRESMTCISSENAK